MSGFATRLSNELGRGIFLVTGKNKGKALWHYVKVPPEKLQGLKHAIKTGALDVAHYGQVLYSGWGEEPPADITQKVKALSQNG